MKTLVLGLQWGDEGKGKVVSYLSKEYDYVVRFCGGPNAGHTIIKNSKKIVHHHLPCIDHEGSNVGYLGPGMVVDLGKLLEELKDLEESFKGVSKRILIDKSVTLILSWHKNEEEFFEKHLNIGTTRKGIGPAYKDKILRLGFKLHHLLSEDGLQLLRKIHKIKSVYVENLEAPEIVFERMKTLLNEILDMGVRLVDCVEMLDEFEKSNVLFESSQGFLLDIDCGTYPYVTSTNVALSGIFKYFPCRLDNVVGVFKAYTTRVGEGPFPTEEKGEMGEILRKKGNEYGATTGRPRRVGWLDLPALKYAIKLTQTTHLVVTKADVLSGLDVVRVATKYLVNGSECELPKSYQDILCAAPVYEEFVGWEDLEDERFFSFVKFLERELKKPVVMISTGPSTDEMRDLRIKCSYTAK